MPDLEHTLQGHDLGFLKIVAEAWGIDLTAPDAPTALPALLEAILDRRTVMEMVDSLPESAQKALAALLESAGKMPWTQFARRFGDVRVFGAAKRDRERPDLKPVSPAEILWYRALIGKVFLDLPPEPQEYAYIPDDLVKFIGLPTFAAKPQYGRPATPGETAHTYPVNDRILDHATTLLAARRIRIPDAELKTERWNVPLPVLEKLLLAAGLLDENGYPIPENSRSFLKLPRSAALTFLAQTWLNSSTFNDLRLLPGLRFEGEWQNNPLATRQAVMTLLSHLPEQTWWHLASFVAAVKENQPDFQRTAGDYDAWFIRRADSDTYLRGFACWDEIEGALLRFIITGILHWLGFTELAAPEVSAPVTAFRFSRWSEALWHGSNPVGISEENQPIKVFSNGRLVLSPLTPRWLRYQIARFCFWEEETEQEYHYRLTPKSLQRAQKQGLRPFDLLKLLQQNAASLPPMLARALERWGKFGTQAHLEQVSLLRVTSPDILTELRKTRAARFLGEALNPTTVVIKSGAIQTIRDSLAEIGYLTDAQITIPENDTY